MKQKIILLLLFPTLERNMKQKIILLLLFPTLLTFLSSCTTGGSFLAHNVTTVELSDPNFKIVARNLEGYSKAEYLIGISYSTGFLANTLALVRIGGTAKLYDDAIQDIWKNYKEKHGDTEGKKLVLVNVRFTEGKKLVLVNVRFDTDILNLLVYTQTELYLHADVIEFEE
jgi:general stress protein CsbA